MLQFIESEEESFVFFKLPLQSLGGPDTPADGKLGGSLSVEVYRFGNGRRFPVVGAFPQEEDIKARLRRNLRGEGETIRDEGTKARQKR